MSAPPKPKIVWKVLVESTVIEILEEEEVEDEDEEKVKFTPGESRWPLPSAVRTTEML